MNRLIKWILIAGGTIVVLLIAAATAIATVLLLLVVSTAGAVFAAQSAYVVTIAGIVWSMLILGETMTIAAWISVAVMLLGLYLVEPAPDEETVEIQMPFNRRASNRGQR